jgi:DNA-binding transcriptional LysR family regulator
LAVKKRINAEADAGRGTKIGNISDCLSTISQKLYGEKSGGAGLLIHASPRGGITRIQDEGRRLYFFALSVIKSMRRAQSETIGQLERSLTIYSASFFAAHILPRLLRDYLKRSPFFRYVWIFERTQTAEILRAVSSGICDVGCCVDAQTHDLRKTELLRARREIAIGKKSLRTDPVETPEAMAGRVVITYEPETLRRLKLDDVFPEPNERGVRVYAESENTIYGWVENDSAIGHGYTSEVKSPMDTQAIFSERMQRAGELRWCAYTRITADGSADARQSEVLKIVEAMRNAGERQ